MVLGPTPPKPAAIDGKRIDVCWMPSTPSAAQLQRMSLEKLIMLDQLDVLEARNEIRRRQSEPQET